MSRAGLKGLVFEKERTHGIVGAGSKGKMCFKVRVAESGDYLLTARSAAPHPTDNNDMWVSSGRGFELVRGEDVVNGGVDRWYKAYQNKGKGEIADYISTVDFNPHTFVVPGVVGGNTFEVCMSGRSFKYEVYSLGLVKCGGGSSCAMGNIRNKFSFSPGSRCI